MTNITISYFDFNGGRGEECRLALHIAGLKFIDDRIKPADWPAMKPSTPFGALPVLDIEGEGTLAQSNAILELIGKRHGLLPTNDFSAAQHIAILNAVEDLHARMAPTMRADEEAKKTLREELAAGFMKEWAMNIEKQIHGPFVGGDLSVADIKLYVLMKWVKSGMLDHISTTYFDDLPKLEALFEAVNTHPKVAEWNAQH